MAHRRKMRDLARAENRESYQRELATARALKRTYVGICEKCGGATRYNGGATRTSRICAACNIDESAARQIARRGRGPTSRKVLAYLTVERSFTDVWTHFDKYPGWASYYLHWMVKYGLVKRVSRGRYIAT